MAYYYVKNGGTATGDAGRYATKQTGTFAALGASGYYNDISAALAATTAPASGDFILVSDSHSYTYAGSVTLTGISPGDFYIVCVDDSNVDAYRASGRGYESAASNQDYSFVDIGMWGMEIAAGDDILPDGNCVFRDCKFTLSEPNDSVNLFNDRRSCLLVDSELALDDAACSVNVQNGSFFYMTGGSVTTLSAGITGFLTGSISGGMSVEMVGVDVSAVTGTLVSGVGANTTDDTIQIRFDRCKLASGVTFTDEDFKFFGQRAEFTRCSNTDNASEYAYHLTAYGGQVDDDDVIYRNDDSAFTDTSTKISYKVVTNSDANISEPLWFDFPIVQQSNLGSTSTLTFYVASTATLNDADVYIQVIYADGTNRVDNNSITSAPNPSVAEVLNPLATPTTLTTDSGSDWRDGAGALTGYNEYKIDIDTVGDPGGNCVPAVRVFVTKASTTLYIASEYTLS